MHTILNQLQKLRGASGTIGGLLVAVLLLVTVPSAQALQQANQTSSDPSATSLRATDTAGVPESSSNNVGVRPREDRAYTGAVAPEKSGPSELVVATVILTMVAAVVGGLFIVKKRKR